MLSQESLRTPSQRTIEGPKINTACQFLFFFFPFFPPGPDEEGLQEDSQVDKVPVDFADLMMLLLLYGRYTQRIAYSSTCSQGIVRHVYLL